MAMALTRISMDLAYLRRPPGVMSTIFVSAASTASRMLVAAAEDVIATGEGERWGPLDHLRYLMMLGIWVHVWGLSVLTDLFAPSHGVSSRGAVGRRVGSSSALVVHGGIRNGGGRSSSTTAIGRALSHMLGILNEVPVTSRKYEYVLAMTDKILNDNVQLGHAALLDVNRAVLGSAFARTCNLLRRALQRSESASSGAAWPSHVLRHLPLGPRLAAWYDGLRLYVSTLLPSAAEAWHRSSAKFQNQLAVPAPASSSHEWLEAEKLAYELLWITNKLRACSAAGEAIERWAAASTIASLSLTAHPRVQGPLIKITAVLYREMRKGEWEVPREMRFGILALWLPLLCYAGNGVTCPVLVGLERWETERVVEDLIADLPSEDQEVVLKNWLEDFAASASDWPNLQGCFDRWCRHSRKLLM